MDLLITARYSSSRLPGKILLDLGGRTVLSHSIMRAQAAGFSPILCTSTDVSDDVLAKEASLHSIRVFRGSLLNKIERWADCFVHFGLPSAHIVDGDDPYFDVSEIFSSMEKLQRENWSLVQTSDRSDSGFATLGMSITSDFIVTLADRSQKLPSQNLDVIPWKKLLHFSDLVIKAADNFLTSDRETSIRLTLDYPEDLAIMRKIAGIFNYDVPRRLLEEYLVQNPVLLSINEARTNDFLTNKKVQLERNFQIEG